MRFILLVFAGFLLPVIHSRELMIQRACAINPNLSFCKTHLTSDEIRSEADKKHDIFLQWAFVAAKDAKDIEDVDTEELESSRQNTGNIEQHCAKYKSNFKSYCTSGKLARLEGLLAQFCTSYQKTCQAEAGEPEIEIIEEEVFPTPKPLFPTEPSHSLSQPQEAQAGPTSDAATTTQVPVETSTTVVTPNYCDDHSLQYIRECDREGFTADDFCGNYKKQCAKVEAVDAESSKPAEKAKVDSLESLEEFDSKEDASTRKPSAESVEGQGASTDEVTTYCTNYIENYNFYCVGDMSPEHEKFCNSYHKNCPNSGP